LNISETFDRDGVFWIGKRQGIGKKLAVNISFSGADREISRQHLGRLDISKTQKYLSAAALRLDKAVALLQVSLE